MFELFVNLGHVNFKVVKQLFARGDDAAELRIDISVVSPYNGVGAIAVLVSVSDTSRLPNMYTSLSTMNSDNFYQDVESFG